MSEYLQDRDTDAKDVQSVYFYWDGSDCETCGWSSDEGEFHIWPDGKFYLSTRYGCYSGHYAESKEEVLEELTHCSNFMYIKDEIKQIKELLNDRD